MTQRICLEVPQAEKKAADKACLCRKLHICVVLRMAAGLIAKLKLRTPYKPPARRDLVEGKLSLRVRGELLVPLDADAAAASCGKLSSKVNLLWHESWMRFSILSARARAPRRTH